MSLDRVSSANTRVYINNILLTGVSDCSIETNRDVENLRSINHYEVTDRIIKSNQIPTTTISWQLGEGSSDPFFNHQTLGIVSVESFDIKKKDTAGIQELASGFLVSYSVDASVGSLIKAEAQYEGLGFNFTESGKLTLEDQTSDYYSAFLPSRIVLSSTFQEGDIFSFPIQSFNINVSVPRTPLKHLGLLSPQYLVPELPVEASISFSAIKNSITGVDFSKIVLEKGDFSFILSGCDVTKEYSIANCSLVGISESIDLDNNATIDFSYSSSITGNSFSYS